MLRKHQPCGVYFMQREYKDNTICQLLRETYRITDDPQVKLNLRVAVSMAKAMDRKLREYKEDWDKGFWDENDPDRI